jgi:hypothetical protein
MTSNMENRTLEKLPRLSERHAARQQHQSPLQKKSHPSLSDTAYFFHQYRRDMSLCGPYIGRDVRLQVSVDLVLFRLGLYRFNNIVEDIWSCLFVNYSRGR